MASNGGVLSNDTNATGRTAVLVTDGSFGSVALNSDGTFTYTPRTTESSPGARDDFWGRDTFTYRIEGGGGDPSNTATVTLLSHNAVLINKLFNQFLNRGPDLPGFEQFTRTFNAGVNLGTLAGSMFESDERLDPIIDDLYQTYLFRNVDPGGLVTWKGEFRNTGGLSIVQAGIISSPEFFNASSAANPSLTGNEGFVTELYRRLLGREPDPEGFQVQVGTLNSGALTRAGIEFGFVDSLEGLRNLVTESFQTHLNRTPSDQDRDGNVAALQNGTSRRQIQVNLINSPEYLNNPLPPTVGTALRTT